MRIAEGEERCVEPAVQAQGCESLCGEIARGAWCGEVSGCVPGLWWEGRPGVCSVHVMVLLCCFTTCFSSFSQLLLRGLGVGMSPTSAAYSKSVSWL